MLSGAARPAWQQLGRFFCGIWEAELGFVFSARQTESFFRLLRHVILDGDITVVLGQAEVVRLSDAIASFFQGGLIDSFATGECACLLTLLLGTILLDAAIHMQTSTATAIAVVLGTISSVFRP